MTNSAISEWQKGGVRYAKLKQIVPTYLAPASLRIFFVAVRHHGGTTRLLNPFTPLQREYVVAATDHGISVLWLKRPGVFRASIGGVEYAGSAQEANVHWQGDSLMVGGISYEPIAFHKEDAEALVTMTSTN